MISDNVLADRLNAFKSGETLPEEYSEDALHQLNTVSEKITQLTKISYEIINLSFVFLQSVAYGFSLKTIFSADWDFLAFLAIGFSIQILTTKIFNLFNK